MTAEKLLKEKSGDACEFSYYLEVIPVSYALEYTRLKCKELLEIVAEKASKMEATIYINPTAPRYARLDKNSILNAVDLDSFIK